MNDGSKDGKDGTQIIIEFSDNDPSLNDLLKTMTEVLRDLVPDHCIHVIATCQGATAEQPFNHHFVTTATDVHESTAVMVSFTANQILHSMTELAKEGMMAGTMPPNSTKH